MNIQATREEIVDLAQSLFMRGYAAGSSGNISVKVEGGYLMTPTNSSLGRLHAENLSFLDEEWNHVDGLPPSKEVAMHRAVYAARPNANAIVHLHSLYATALSCLEHQDSSVAPYTPYVIMRMGENIPVVPYYRPGDPAMEESIFTHAVEANALLLSNHGSLVAESTLTRAVDSAEELETSARLAFLLRGQNARLLTKSQVAELLKSQV